MARLASQMKMGFYATPVNVVRQIKNLLNIRPGARLLDTCCGEGEALQIIADGTDVVTYGVELDRERFNKAKEVLHNAVWADSVYELRTSVMGFGLLWLNPPYDYNEGGYEQTKERLEIQFLKHHWKYLRDGGVLVYIIPFSALKKTGVFLEKKCKNLVILRFPDDDFKQFKQIVVICQKGRPGKQEKQSNYVKFDTATSINIYDVVELDKIPVIESAGVVFDIPASDGEDVFFRSVRLDPEEGLAVIRQKSAIEKRIKNIITPPQGFAVQPLTPLREGHLAMLLASGMMNGEVVGEDGKRLIVKGSVHKVQDVTEEKTESTDKHIETDRYEITVRAICFDPEPEIITIK